MKLPIRWLQDWIEFDGGADAVAEALTRRGFYVEGIERLGHELPGVVIARVLEVAKHPNADKLSLCRVNAGGDELRIVCGAPNVRAGMLVPLATIGATLPNGLTIKKSKIRGEESQGMLCSARELALSDDHGGILDLEAWRGASQGLEPGRPFQSLLPPPDAVLEVEVPFNRPDGLGVVGLAREVRAALGGRWTDAARERLAAKLPGGAGFDLELEDAEGCPRYVAQAIENVRVAPSPAWLRERLESAGQRSINNVVDATNLVLLEFGQPVHAFDLDRLAGPRIRVRRARAGETLVTLDGKPRTLSDEVLVIADGDGPTALAGIMGGAASEVSERTTRVLLECAWFQPARVRRGSRSLGLSTEASKRYERGVDPDATAAAAARFVELVRELSPGAALGAASERRHARAQAAPLTLRPSRVARLTGLELDAARCRAHLEAMEFGVAGGDPLMVTVPSWRADVTLEDDLVEEVARAEGYDRIPNAALETHGAHAKREPRESVTSAARHAMRALGFTEAWCTTLVSAREAAAAAALLGDGADSLVALSNPLSEDRGTLRPNPLPGLLRALAHNLRQGRTSVRLFEVGAGFRVSSAALPEERVLLGAIVTGARFAHAHDASQGAVDFADAKGLWEAWLDQMGVDTPRWRTYSAAGWKPGASAEVASSASRIGWAGTLSPSWLREWQIETPAAQDVHAFVACLDPLLASRPERRGVVLPGRFPPVRRDLAFFVPERTTHAEVTGALQRAGGEWLSALELFDVYSGPGTPEGMKSLAYALEWQHPERTFAESEVEAIQTLMVTAVATDCGGRLREK